jgi:hypothetical protein
MVLAGGSAGTNVLQKEVSPQECEDPGFSSLLPKRCMALSL